MTDSQRGSRCSSTEGDHNDDGPITFSKDVSGKQSNSSHVAGKEASPANSGNESADRTQIIPYAIDSQDERRAGDLTSVSKEAMTERDAILAERGCRESTFSISTKAKVDWSEERRMDNEDAVMADMDPALEISSSLSEREDHSVSLRAWLSNPARGIDHIENLHIFKQIAEFVELAHSQGVVLRNIRPSSFLLSSFSRISIIESASSQTSSSSSAESNGRDAALNLASTEQLHLHKSVQMCGKSEYNRSFDFEMPGESTLSTPASTQRESLNPGSKSQDSCSQCLKPGDHQQCAADDECGGSYSSSSSEHADDQSKIEKFPLKEILSMEIMWYRSPEEIAGGTPEFSSDIYNLGVLLAELFYTSGSQGEWSRAMSDLKHRLLPPSFLLDFPKEAAFCLLLLHPIPHCRPKAREILHADIFGCLVSKLAEREAIIQLEEKLSEAEATLDFLRHLQQKKRFLAEKIVQEVSTLNEDIEEVKRWQISWNKGFQEKEMNFVQRFTLAAASSKYPTDYSTASEIDDATLHSREGIRTSRQELLTTKSAQLLKSFTELREAYLSMISIDHPITSSLANEVLKESKSRKELSAASVFSSVGGQIERESAGRLGCFFDDFSQFMKYSKFDVKSSLQYGDILNTKNMVCSLSFDCDDDYFATAGVSKRIKIFDCNALLENGSDVHFPVVEMYHKKKLSCVCWNKFRKNILSSSDLEGAVQLWDVMTGQMLLEVKEHSKIAWSVDFSHFDSLRMASGSDDCCVKLWSIHQATSIGTIKTKANICSVQFSPNHSHILAFGSADSQIYLHDLRYIRIPFCILTGHQKAVSFVRFVDSSCIVSASTDNTLKLWDLSSSNTITKGFRSGLGLKVDCAVTYTGHTNLKNFVGLSVAEEGYIACGSETDEVYVYHKSLPMPMFSHKFKSSDPISGEELEDLGDQQFVSSVCWRNKSLVLVIANSVGNIQVLEMV